MSLFGKGYDQGTLYFSQGRMTDPDDLKSRMMSPNDHGAIAGLQAAFAKGAPKSEEIQWKTNFLGTNQRRGYPTRQTRS